LDSFFDVSFFSQTPFFLESLHSTNDYLKEIVSKNKVNEGFSVFSDFQTSGRGQLSNVWHSSASQNILFSFVVFPKKISVQDIFILNQWISISIIEGLQKVLHQNDKLGKLHIKWPNDIFLNQKKIGGILIENSISSNGIEQSIIGIGLNINEIDFPKGLSLATSLKKECNYQWNRIQILNTICTEIEANYTNLLFPFSRINSQNYFKYLLGFGKKRLFIIEEKKREATIIDIDPYGRIVLEFEDKSTQLFGMKEVQFVF
jgi:BirA family biotin operon repressor/biotin-[acetyl-CoA-carboxylase] ligase